MTPWATPDGGNAGFRHWFHIMNAKLTLEHHGMAMMPAALFIDMEIRAYRMWPASFVTWASRSPASAASAAHTCWSSTSIFTCDPIRESRDSERRHLNRSTLQKKMRNPGLSRPAQCHPSGIRALLVARFKQTCLLSPAEILLHKSCWRRSLAKSLWLPSVSARRLP